MKKLEEPEEEEEQQDEPFVYTKNEKYEYNEDGINQKQQKFVRTSTTNVIENLEDGSEEAQEEQVADAGEGA